MTKKQNLLFICSRNQWRSPTGEAIYRQHEQYNARSAGTSPNARKTVGPKDIEWADIIFVMEDKHKSRLKAQFNRLLQYKKIVVLDIPDIYQYNDPELIAELSEKVESYLQ